LTIGKRSHLLFVVLGVLALIELLYFITYEEAERDIVPPTLTGGQQYQRCGDEQTDTPKVVKKHKPKHFQFLGKAEGKSYYRYPQWTKELYTFRTLPPQFRDELTKSWLQNRDKREKEPNYRYIHYNTNLTQEEQQQLRKKESSITYTISLEKYNPELAYALLHWVKAEITEWIGIPIVVTKLDFIREYTDGAILEYHTDDWKNHILSAVFHVGSISPKADWPLNVFHRDSDESIDIPGVGAPDVILFESATLAHGRPTPFQGYCFANMYINFQPVNWSVTFQELNAEEIKEEEKYS